MSLFSGQVPSFRLHNVMTTTALPMLFGLCRATMVDVAAMAAATADVVDVGVVVAVVVAGDMVAAVAVAMVVAVVVEGVVVAAGMGEAAVVAVAVVAAAALVAAARLGNGNQVTVDSCWFIPPFFGCPAESWTRYEKPQRFWYFWIISWGHLSYQR